MTVKVRLSNGKVVSVKNYTTISTSNTKMVIEYTDKGGNVIRAAKYPGEDGPYDPYTQVQ